MAANAAFAVIKQTLCNGKDLVDAGKSVGVYFKAENDIAKEVEAKGRASALEAYQAQQQLRKQEAELKEMLNKQGLMGYHNFLEFKAQFARDKKEAAKIRAKKKHQRAEAFAEALTLGIKVMLGLLITVAALFGAAIYLR